VKRVMRRYISMNVPVEDCRSVHDYLTTDGQRKGLKQYIVVHDIRRVRFEIRGMLQNRENNVMMMERRKPGLRAK
jgi:hypothetical protein